MARSPYKPSWIWKLLAYVDSPRPSLAGQIAGIDLPPPDLSEGLRSRRPGIGPRSVTPWCTLGTDLRAKERSGADAETEAEKFGELREALRAVVTQTHVDAPFTCDLRDVEGIAVVSDPALVDGESMDEVVPRSRKGFLDDQSQEGVEGLLVNGSEAPILRGRGSPNRFACYAGDPRLFLLNSARGHRICVARKLARRHGYRIELEGQLDRWTIDRRAIETLQERYRLIIVGSESVSGEEMDYPTLLSEALRDAERPSWHHFRCPATGQPVLAFSRNEEGASESADLLVARGGIDYAALLEKLL